jgi:hypothetical protein
VGKQVVEKPPITPVRGFFIVAGPFRHKCPFKQSFGWPAIPGKQLAFLKPNGNRGEASRFDIALEQGRVLFFSRIDAGHDWNKMEAGSELAGRPAGTDG